MNNEKAELISALADDHLRGREREAALAALREHDHLRERWQRYHLIGDVVRGEAGVHGGPDSDRDLAARIREELESEPLHMMPRRRVTPAVGWAMAASGVLAAVLFAATSPFDGAGTPTTVAQIQNQNQPPRPAVVSEGGWDRLAVAERPVERVRLDERELAPYLVNHHAYANALGVPAAVRIVSHEVRR